MGTAPGGLNIWDFPLKVVRINYDGTDWGKTTADTEWEKTEDIKDIIYQQPGTQYYDKIPTGFSLGLKVTFGEISTALLAKMHDAVTLSGAGNSLKWGKNLFHSWREQAKQLIVRAVDGDGDSYLNPFFKFIAPLAYPEITSTIVWGADTQRSLGVTFWIFYDEDDDLFIYSGYGSSLGI